MDGTSIWLPFEVKDELSKIKIHEREPYYQVVKRLLSKVDK